MPTFINTTGEPTLGIAICGRCQKKVRLADLVDDGNRPGFKVHKPELSPGCWDNFDPMRLPPPPPDNMRLPFNRPDVDLTMDPPAPPVLPPFNDGH